MLLINYDILFNQLNEPLSISTGQVNANEPLFTTGSDCKVKA